ncbi:MAG: hypothetical protein CL678_03630 [Bdellovibrionaceae bacterium]|nr:hypothetical protein [Pseudobdellovibrionaceae bacterium]|tara:strand:- start:1140 stop:1844 length:705 start_codon:yes stop_codon:yes gene_type:complete
MFLFSFLTLHLNAKDFESPFPPTAPGIQIPNAHVLKENKLMRGMDPSRWIEDLKTANINQILIFKNNSRHSVTKEIKVLKKAGYKMNQIHHIPFLWKDMGGFKKTCLQTIEALQKIKNVMNTPNQNLYFHCTMGEDRTGYLAGLYRILNDHWTVSQAFQREMCERGYAGGNPYKPMERVTLPLRKELTVHFVQMLKLIRSKKLRWERLDPRICEHEPQVTRNEVESYFCEPQPL